MQCLACKLVAQPSGRLQIVRPNTQEDIAMATYRHRKCRPDDPYVLANAAFALGRSGEDIAPAIALIDRALQLNPSFAHGWYNSGTIRLWAGQYDLAIEHLHWRIRKDREYFLEGLRLAAGQST
jgi:tetratricopeptide (TPR) repeat protein